MCCASLHGTPPIGCCSLLISMCCTSLRVMHHGHSAKLVEETCDFQRSMANNEAKLKENEEDFRRAQRGFVEDLEKANAAYTRNR